MTAEIIMSNSICDYCKNQFDYKGTGDTCRVWYYDKVCENAEDFEGLELIEVEE